MHIHERIQFFFRVSSSSGLLIVVVAVCMCNVHWLLWFRWNPEFFIFTFLQYTLSTHKSEQKKIFPRNSRPQSFRLRERSPTKKKMRRATRNEFHLLPKLREEIKRLLLTFRNTISTQIIVWKIYMQIFVSSIDHLRPYFFTRYFFLSFFFFFSSLLRFVHTLTYTAECEECASNKTKKKYIHS